MKARNHPFFTYALAVIFVSSLILFFRHTHFLSDINAIKVPSDFNTYLTSRDRLRAHLNPYAIEDEKPYKYSPAAILVFSALPDAYPQAWLTAKAILIGFWAVALAVGASYTSFSSFLLMIVGILISWKGILESLDFGQLEPVCLFLSVMTAHFFLRFPFLGGLLIGFLPAIKLPWGFLVAPYAVYLIYAQERALLKRFLGGTFFSIFTWSTLIPYIAFGLNKSILMYQRWFSVLGAQPQALFESDFNQSIWITLKRILLILGLPEVLFFPLSLFSILILYRFLKVLIRVSPDKREPLAWITPWLLLMQLIQPLSWRWGSLFLVGAPLSYFSTEKKIFPKKEKILLAFLCVLFLFQQTPIVRNFGFRHWSGLHGYGLITFYWLGFLALIVFSFLSEQDRFLKLKRKAGRRDEEYERRDKRGRSRGNNPRDRRKNRRRT